MTEPKRDEGNLAPTAGGEQHVLAYAEAEPARAASGALANVAVWASASFLPVIFGSICIGAGVFVLPAICLPLTGLVLGLAARGDRTADERTRRTARRAVFLGGGQLVLVGLVALLLPSMGRAREPANRIKCASNLRQVGQALQIYANDYGGMYPPSFDELLVYGDLFPEAFVCPSSDDVTATGATTRAMLANLHRPGFCSYVYAFDGQTLAATTLTPKHVLAYEDLTNHDRRGMNVLYGDGSVQWLDVPAAEHVIAELQAGHNPPRPPK